jgi:hypothetical protein
MEQPSLRFGAIAVVLALSLAATAARADEVEGSAEDRLDAEKPWGFIVPTYLVGGIFTAGGISALLLYGGETGPLDVGQSDVPADERRFHRNLGIVSLAVGVPLIGLATYLAIAGGRPVEERAAAAPGSAELVLGAALDREGRPVGLGIVGSF